MDTTITSTIMIAIAHSVPTPGGRAFGPSHIQRSNNISNKNNTLFYFF